MQDIARDNSMACVARRPARVGWMRAMSPAGRTRIDGLRAPFPRTRAGRDQPRRGSGGVLSG
jgi:hypothetical protein